MASLLAIVLAVTVIICAKNLFVRIRLARLAQILSGCCGPEIASDKCCQVSGAGKDCREAASGDVRRLSRQRLQWDLCRPYWPIDRVCAGKQDNGADRVTTCGVCTAGGVTHTDSR